MEELKFFLHGMNDSKPESSGIQPGHEAGNDFKFPPMTSWIKIRAEEYQ
jgi:hypothetical protein